MSTDAILYKNRPEWADIAPVLAEEGSDAPVRMTYSPLYEDALNYLRAVLVSNETSERVLALTGDIIGLNPAYYTAWQHRRTSLIALRFLTAEKLRIEIDLTSSIIKRSSKNYQVWHHRRWAVENIMKALEGSEERARHAIIAAELDLTAHLLHEVEEADAKNYHVWSHRQWVVRTYDAWDRELGLVKTLLDLDFRNNSAWNHRWLVLTKGRPSSEILRFPAAAPTTSSTTAASPTPLLPFPTIAGEMDFALSYMKRAYRNESAWNYLRALMQAATATAAVSGAVVDEFRRLYPFMLGPGIPMEGIRARVDAEAITKARESAEPMTNALANEAGADLLVGDACQLLLGSMSNKEAAKEKLSASKRLLEACIEGDEIRSNYWKWRAGMVDALLATIA
jgi:protein farnesyltransferase/geranylgeranyltransferase type-1 subunit alpha